MAASPDTRQDFLRFSAYSFKSMLTRKLSEDTRFTDQVYEGSNLAVLIDLCAYLFQCMTFALNNAASESMFSDTQIYENINRLVKLIGYNPKGFIPSAATFQFYIDGEYDDLYIPQYAAVDTGLTDSNGDKVFYSFTECYDVAAGVNTVTLHNGRWHLYSTIFTANGSNYETFTLDGVKSDSDTLDYVAYGYIDVYVKRNGTFLKFKGLTDEIFVNNSSKYSTDSFEDMIDIYKNTDDDRYFSIRLNHEKTYEIKFGNDNNGQKLEAGDQLYVFYMKSNGFDANLQIGDVQDARIYSPTRMVGVSEELIYRKIIQCESTIKTDDATVQQIETMLAGINSVTNISQSTTASAEESVEDIKNVAPDYYKLGNRLITKSDFEYYVKNKYKDNIIDAKCQNNWDYISQFYGWLYKIGQSGVYVDVGQRTSDSTYYMTQSRMSKSDYYYADPADENNVYLWIKMRNNIEIEKKRLDEDLTPIKVLTAEIVFAEPLDFMFALCAAPLERALQYIKEQSLFDETNETKLEITISDNSLYSNTSIQAQVKQLFVNFFNQNNMRLGQTIDVNELLDQIYSINGVQRVRTVFSSPEVNLMTHKKTWQDRYVDGISFATWTNDVIDRGDDMSVSTSNRTLETFQFPKLYTSQMMKRIVIIKKSFSNNSTVQY